MYTMYMYLMPDHIVGDLRFDPGSLNRATGEKVTESEVSRVFRGTDNIGNGSSLIPRGSNPG